ncbi:MAG: hypothetical protein QXW75_00580 [Thermoplasmatales archaeon]
MVRQGVVYTNNVQGPLPSRILEWDCQKCGAAFPSRSVAEIHEKVCTGVLGAGNGMWKKFLKYVRRRDKK